MIFFLTCHIALLQFLSHLKYMKFVHRYSVLNILDNIIESAFTPLLFIYIDML